MRVGNIIVPVTVASVLERDKEIAFDALVDSGAFGLILPAAWKERLGALPDPVMVDVETADQRIVPAEVCGPVRIQIGGFRRVLGEVIFMEMQPGRRGYEPLVGYTVLELAGAVIDMVTHRLLARKYFDLKVVTAAPGGPTARAAHPAPR